MDSYKVRIDDPLTHKITNLDDFYKTIPKKEEPWCKSELGKDERHFAVCPYCQNPIQICGLSIRHNNGNPVRRYGKHYRHSIKYLAVYHAENYDSCILASPNRKTFGDTHCRRNILDPQSKNILNLVKTQLDRMFYILQQDTGIVFSLSLIRNMLLDYHAVNGITYKSSYPDNLPWTFVNIILAKSLFGQKILASSLLAEQLKMCHLIKLEPVKDDSSLLFVHGNGKFIHIMFEFRNLKLNEKDEQSIEFRVYTDNQEDMLKPHILFKNRILIDTSKFSRLINSERPEWAKKRWNDIQKIISEVYN